MAFSVDFKTIRLSLTKVPSMSKDRFMMTAFFPFYDTINYNTHSKETHMIKKISPFIQEDHLHAGKDDSGVVVTNSSNPMNHIGSVTGRGLELTQKILNFCSSPHVTPSAHVTTLSCCSRLPSMMGIAHYPWHGILWRNSLIFLIPWT